MPIVESSSRAGPLLAVMLGAALLCPAPSADSAVASATAEPMAAAFGALPQVSDVQLSPDGRLLAWSDQSGGAATKVVIFDLDAKAYRRTVNIDPALKERSLQWSGNDALLVTVSDTNPPLWVHADSYEMFRTLAITVDSGETRMLLMGEGERAFVTGAQLIAWHTAKPDTVVMATLDYAAGARREELGTRLVNARADSGWVAELFAVDTRTGKGTMIDQGDAFTQQWVTDVEGEPVARSEWRAAEHRYLIQAKVGSGWHTILERSDGTAMTLYGVGTDGKSVIASGPSEGGRVKLWAVALDGSGAKDLLPDAGVDVEGVIRDRFSGTPVAAQLGGPDLQTDWLDPVAKARHDSVAHAFAGREVRVYGRSEDGSRVLAEVEGPSQPPVYYLVDFKTHRADIVGDAYPELDNVTLGAVHSISYQARDGTPIPAYLTLPPGKDDPKGLPMVILPHGGPEARDVPEFDWLAQFFATRGYAVLQPQFRGSTGFGVAFERAGAQQWGGLMQDDVTDGVKAMVQRGIADPKRICIVGGSYGGYAALAGAAFTPDIYACAVSINGVSDLPGMLMYERQHYGPESDAVLYWQREIGGPTEQSVIDHSPLHAVAAIKVPVLLLHASDDTVVPVGQSQEMASALEQLGKPVTFVKLAGEDHWLSRAQTRLEVLEETDRFLRRYLQ